MKNYERIERHPIDIEDVIKELRERVAEAKENSDIMRPVSYALYHLWYDIDRTEKRE